MSLGRAIKHARGVKGWKQKDLQVATGLSQKYLSEIELDKVDPRVSIVQRIACALGVPCDALLTPEPPTPAAVGISYWPCYDAVAQEWFVVVRPGRGESGEYVALYRADSEAALWALIADKACA